MVSCVVNTLEFARPKVCKETDNGPSFIKISVCTYQSSIYDGTESIRTQVNSYLSQFVLILVNSYSIFGQFVLILLNLVNSFSFWSIRTQFGQFVLIPNNIILMIYII